METNKINNLIRINDNLHQLANKNMVDVCDSLSNKGFFCALVLGKAFKTHESIILLAKNGYGEDAFVLCRSIFELLIMSSYILSDHSEDLLMRYVEFDWVTRKQMLDYATTKDSILDAINKQIESGEVQSNTLKVIGTEFARVMKKYNYKISQGWSDKNIFEMSKQVGREDAYKTVYKLQCSLAHNNARSMNEYMKLDHTGIVIRVAPSSDMVDTALVTAFDFFGFILELVSRELKLTTETELDSLAKTFTKILKADL